MFDLAARLIGCDWGTRVRLPHDREVCTRQARQRIAVHGQGVTHFLKVCDEHATTLERETDPHV